MIWSFIYIGGWTSLTMTFFDKFKTQDIQKYNSSHDYELIKSIIENLNNILNTKKQFGCFIKGFGIEDMNQFTSREYLVPLLIEEVKYNIEHFEPRLILEDIEVVDTDQPFLISFKIKCKVKDSSKSLRMEFDSIYNNFTIVS